MDKKGFKHWLANVTSDPRLEAFDEYVINRLQLADEIREFDIELSKILTSQAVSYKEFSIYLKRKMEK